jgi:hypothetical protein
MALTAWCCDRELGFVLNSVADDPEVLDRAIDERRHDRKTATLGNDTDLLLGTVIIASVPVRSGGCGRVGIPCCA